MRFFGAHQHILPSRHNTYRPHLLRRGALVVFLGLILLSESTLVGIQFASPAARANIVAAAAAPSPASVTSQISKQFAKILTNSEWSANWFLAALALMLGTLILFGFFFRPQVQPVHALAPALTLFCTALLLIALNVAVLGHADAQTAAAIFSGY